MELIPVVKLENVTVTFPNGGIQVGDALVVSGILILNGIAARIDDCVIRSS